MKAAYCDQRQGHRGLVPGAPLVPGALLGTKGEGAREAEETKRKPRRRQRQELNGGGAGRGRKNTQGERRTTVRLGLRPLSPRGKAGTRAADSRERLQWNQLSHFRASFVNENASIFRKVKLRLFLISAFQLRHQDWFTQLRVTETGLLPPGSITL